MITLSEPYLRKRSQHILSKRAKESQIINDPKTVPVLLPPNDIKAGRVLGKGNFCIVSALEGLNLNHEHQHAEDEEKTSPSRDACTSFCRELGSRNGKKMYAIKRLKPGLYFHQSNLHFAQGIIDLAMEAKYLSALQHPHIIGIRAIADSDDASEDFFIILDRLVITLEDQITTWQNSLDCRNAFGRKKINSSELFCEKLVIGHDICSALAYLHSKKIVYRDLKPKNLGFDELGNVKIFDFGTATEMTEKKRHNATNTFKLSKRTGTPKYMAPEVYVGQPYNEKCDVYSFAILLWQCIECKRPFECYDGVIMEARVFNGKDTPKLNKGWSSSFKSLLLKCWLRDFNRRHSCIDVMTLLNEEVEKTIK